jgi:hypothetical protein
MMKLWLDAQLDGRIRFSSDMLATHSFALSSPVPIRSGAR